MKLLAMSLENIFLFSRDMALARKTAGKAAWKRPGLAPRRAASRKDLATGAERKNKFVIITMEIKS